MNVRPGGEVVAGQLAGIDRAIVLGANGWFGRTALDLLEEAWGDEAGSRILAFARGEHEVALRSGQPLNVAPMASLESVQPAPGTILIDCAYPTQEKVDDMGVGEYRSSVEALRRLVTGQLERLRPDACVSLSSGAATCGPDAPERTRVYGEMKRRDEEELLELCPRLAVRLCIARVYAASGPHMTKPETYALGDLIAQARAGGPMRVRATRPVVRSYALAADILAVALVAALSADPASPELFETGGEEIEVGDLAVRVSSVVLGEALPVELPDLDGSSPDRYVGDPSRMEELASQQGIELVGLDEQIARTA